MGGSDDVNDAAIVGNVVDRQPAVCNDVDQVCPVGVNPGRQGDPMTLVACPNPEVSRHVSREELPDGPKSRKMLDDVFGSSPRNLELHVGNQKVVEQVPWHEFPKGGPRAN
jgi:hypothetical protein